MSDKLHPVWGNSVSRIAPQTLRKLNNLQGQERIDYILELIARNTQSSISIPKKAVIMMQNYVREQTENFDLLGQEYTAILELETNGETEFNGETYNGK